MLEKLRRPVPARKKRVTAACCLLAGLLLGGFIFQCAQNDLGEARETVGDDGKGGR